VVFESKTRGVFSSAPAMPSKEIYKHVTEGGSSLQSRAAILTKVSKQTISNRIFCSWSRAPRDGFGTLWNSCSIYIYCTDFDLHNILLFVCIRCQLLP